MKLRSPLLVIVLFLLFCETYGQVSNPQISISNQNGSTVCSFAETKISATLTGQFNNDNKFFAEFVNTSTNAILGRYEANYKNGTMVFIVTSDNLTEQQNVSFRISSTSPAVNSNFSYSNTFYNRGQVSLTGSTALEDTLNPGARISASIGSTANNSVQIVLNDSSSYTFRSSSFPNYIEVAASATGDIFIVRATNSCGIPVPVSGRIPVSVNSISITPTKINSQAVCEGSEIELGFSTTGGTIPASSKFRLRLIKSGNPSAASLLEVPAVLKKDGVLTAQIPENEKITDYYSAFQVAILVDKPALVSPLSYSFHLYKKPTGKITSQSRTIPMGESFQIDLSVTGPRPAEIEFNNGMIHTFNSEVGYTSTSFTMRPTKTETYSIKSLRTPCGTITDLPKQTIVATVQPGISIPLPIYQNVELCENQKLRLPFASNAVLNSNTTYLVEGVSWKDKVYQFEAKIVNDSLEFFIPHSPLEWTTDGYFDITGFRAKTINPSYTSPTVGRYTIRGIPRVSYDTYNSTTLPYPQYYDMTIKVGGGWPFYMIGPSGEFIDNNSNGLYQRIFVPKTGTYQPKSVRNVCYSTDKVTPLSFVVQDYKSTTPVIVVHPPKGDIYVCEKDSIEVYFEALGQYSANNEFKIRHSEASQPLMTVKNPGRYKLPASVLPVNSYTYIIVESTSPAVVSSYSKVVVRRGKPVVSFDNPNATKPENALTFEPDQRPYISWNVQSYPYALSYTDGVKSYVFEKRIADDMLYVSPPKSKVTPYTLTSVSNGCYNDVYNSTTYVFWKGYNLSLKYFVNNQKLCVGEVLTIPLTIEKGTPATGTKYYLQVGKEIQNVTNFETIADVSTSGSEFKYTIPASMEGTYKIRVISDDQIYSDTKQITINNKPRVTITSGTTGESFEIPYGQTTALTYDLAGGEPYKLIPYGYPETDVTGTSKIQRQYTPSTSTVFQAVSVSNQCGYGTTSGSVSVKVNPIIATLSPSLSTTCSGNTLPVKFQVGGDIPTGEKIGFYLTRPTGGRIDVGSTTLKSGDIPLNIPPNLPYGVYKLTCYITGTDIMLSKDIVIDRAPDIELIGHTTVNSGETAYLEVRAKSSGNQTIFLKWSDGSTESIQFSSFSQVYYKRVSPQSTTTYTITSAESQCGAVKYSGSATVVVNAPSDRTVKITSVSGRSCESDTVVIYFTKAGNFSAGNQFTVQLYNSQGQLSKALVTVGKDSPLKAVIPSGLSLTESFRVRTVASDPNTSAGDFPTPIRINKTPSAKFAQSQIYQDKSGSVQVVVILDGNGPWQYKYGSDLTSTNRTANVSPDTINIANAAPSAFFKLLSVSNSCGIGAISEPSTIKIEVILGTEDPDTHMDLISFGPNPASNSITLKFKTNSNRKLTLYNLAGIPVLWQNSSEKEVLVNIEQRAAGTYLLKIERQGYVRMYRIIKH